MTATPIPRTLTLTAYGDMESSRLTEKPEGRHPIDTRIFSVERLDEIVSAVQRALDQGAKIYWICPLVEESEALDIAAAEDRYAHLKQVFGAQVGLVHGKMKGPDKDAVMENFAGSGIDVLVATTGGGSRCGCEGSNSHGDRARGTLRLAQLHQLRGRIGRGAKSTCMLLYGTGLSVRRASASRSCGRQTTGFELRRRICGFGCRRTYGHPSKWIASVQNCGPHGPFRPTPGGSGRRQNYSRERS